VPALIELLGGVLPALALLGACLAWAFATGAIHIWGATFGLVLEKVANVLPGAVKVFGRTILPDLAGMVRAADVAVQDYLKVWRKGAELEIALSLHLLKLVWQAQAEALDWIATETAKTFDHVVHVHVPKAVKYAVPFVLTPLLLARIVRAVLPHIRVGTNTVTHWITRELPTTTARVSRAAIAAAYPDIRALPGLRREVYGLTRRWARINARLHRLEGLFGATALAVAMANVFGLPNWRCLTRGNVGKLVRGVCGLPAHLLSDVLGLLADFLVLENLCDVLPWVEAAASSVAVPFVDAVTTISSANAGCLAKQAPAAAPLQLYLPSVAPSLTAGV